MTRLLWPTTLLWCAAAIAALAAAFLLAGPATGRAGVARGGATLLFDETALAPETIEEIAIRRGGEASMRLRRSGESWVEVEPSGLPVDPFAVRDLLDTARRLEASRRVSIEGPDGAALARSLGIDPPAATLAIRHAGGETLVRLGRMGLAGRAFIQVVEGQGDRAADIAVVGQDLHALLQRQPPEQWRQRGLFPEAGAETRGIEYTASGTTVRLARSGARWRMEAPVATRVDDLAMDAYLAALARTECAGFAGDATTTERLELAGLLPPVASLRVESGAAGRASGRTLQIGRAMTVGGGDRFGMLEGHPVLLVLAQGTLQSLFAAPAALIDPTACEVLPADVKRIRIRSLQGGADEEFSIERDLDRWRCPEAGGAEVDLPRVGEFLSRLTEARATAINLNPIPRERLVGRIDLMGFDGALLAAIDVGIDAAGAHVALDSGDGVARIFPAAAAPGLTRTALGVPGS